MEESSRETPVIQMELSVTKPIPGGLAPAMGTWTVGLLAMLLAAPGCKDSKPYPTAKAPPTLEGLDASSGTARDDEDDEDEQDDETAPAPRPRWHRKPSARADTINGHPKGPKAAAFNAVVRSAYGKANACFAARIQALGKGPLTMQVRITVGNDGKVRLAKVVSGIKDPQVRACVLSVFRGLRFPAYEGPDVSQVVPLTVVRAQ